MIEIRSGNEECYLCSRLFVYLQDRLKCSDGKA
jgi:hypothetical protein